MTVADEEPTGDEEKDFREMLARFKQGIDENIEETDFQSHYDLGVAFKEMGLLDEAIAEFQKALAAPEGKLRTTEALGACFIERRAYVVAESILRRGLDLPASGDRERLGVLYWLARALEELGKKVEAREFYGRVFAVDIRYGLSRAKLLAETDELTGLLNIRGFSIAANRLFGQALRYNRAAAVMMIDSDNLKSVNDSYGHEAGNQMLSKMARLVLAELRSTDVVARYGGDEFIVLLPETPAKGALDVAERIRDAVGSLPLDLAGNRVTCTVSIGLAVLPADGNSLDALVARADRAMYQAKKTGRN